MRPLIKPFCTQKIIQIANKMTTTTAYYSLFVSKIRYGIITYELHLIHNSIDYDIQRKKHQNH